MMYGLLLYFPFARARVCGLGGRWLGRRGRTTIRTRSLRLSRVRRWRSFYEVGIRGVNASVTLRNWFRRERMDIKGQINVDRLTRTMRRLVTTVSTLVHLYSREYLGKDPHLPRYYSYLAFFTFTMMVLVTRRDLVQLFFGWEGVGVASYLLIQFWYRRSRRNRGANKAMIYNRIGDIRLALGAFRAYNIVGSVDFATLTRTSRRLSERTIHIINWERPRLTRIRRLLLIGAMGKSAQIGLHPWLPDAMEGPTPVSALIHAATMVTAGVYLLVRTSRLNTETSLRRVRIVGALTSLFAVSIGSGQTDRKRMIAYSTCSQLGFMVFACGAGQFARAIYHLFTHGFYKRLLFLGRGSVIHAMSDEQDLRGMGGGRRVLPLTRTTLVIGSCALRGFPFRAGFYSKDLIIETAQGVPTVLTAPMALCRSLRAYGTAFYSSTLIMGRFLGRPKGGKAKVTTRQEPGMCMTIPLRRLRIARIFIGWFAEDLLVGIGTPFWGSSVHRNVLTEGLIGREYQSWKILPLRLSFVGAFFGVISYEIPSYNRPRQNFLSRRWGIDRVYNRRIASPRFNHGWATTYRRLDQGILEYMAPYRRTQRTYIGSEQARVPSKSSTYGEWTRRMLARTVIALYFILFYMMRRRFIGRNRRISRIRTLRRAFRYGPYWISRRIQRRLPLEALHLYQQTERITRKSAIFLTVRSFFPVRRYYMKNMYWKSIRKRILRRSFWRSCFFFRLWMLELQGDLSLEEELWYQTEYMRQRPRTPRVVFRELTPKRVESRFLLRTRFCRRCYHRRILFYSCIIRRTRVPRRRFLIRRVERIYFFMKINR